MITPDPTGPLTDHEIAQVLATLPSRFTAHRAASELVKLRAFVVTIGVIADTLPAGPVRESLSAALFDLHQEMT